MAKLILQPKNQHIHMTLRQPIELHMAKYVPMYQGSADSAQKFKTASVQPIGGHRVVIVLGADGIDYADANNIAHAGLVLGITTTAAAKGDRAAVQTSDDAEHDGWAFTPNKPVFVGSNGMLTQVVPTTSNSKFHQQIGTALSANKLHIQIFQPTKLT